MSATGVSVPAAAAVARKVVGPARPPVKKQKRKMGLAIASLEVDGMFARGDWAEIERFCNVSSANVLGRLVDLEGV